MLRVSVLLVPIFILVVLNNGVIGECPNEHDIPVMYNSTHYLGCYYYIGGNAETAIQACPASIPPELLSEGYENNPTNPQMTFYDHALVVRPGCTVYEFTENGFQGDVYEYPAGVYPNVLSDGVIFSFLVRCDIEHIDCSPTDEFSIVLVCDALDAAVDSTCTYVRTVGTSYTESIMESMSLDAALQEEMEDGFFGFFSDTLGVSVNTGYDWTHVSESTQGEVETFEVSAIAPAGYILTIEQVMGHCGGSEVNTDYFKISQTNKDGFSTINYVKAVGGNIPLL